MRPDISPSLQVFAEYSFILTSNPVMSHANANANVRPSKAVWP